MTAYGIYRERARSAVLATVMFDRDAAVAQAETLSNHGHGPHLVAAWHGPDSYQPATIRYNDPTGLHYIARCGDWDSRSAYQPYPAPGAVIR